MDEEAPAAGSLRDLLSTYSKDLEINQDKIICTISRLGKNNFKENFLLNIETINNEIVYNKNHIIQENKSNYIINLGLPNEIISQVKISRRTER